jgi:hypothetical protein
VTPARGKTRSGSVLPPLFHCHGNGAPAIPRSYIVSVIRTMANVCTASKASACVVGSTSRSPNTFGVTAGMPAIAIRASRGPANTRFGRNALRTAISSTDGSCL